MNVLGGTADVTTYFVLRLAATGVEATALDVTTFDLQYVRTGIAPVAKVDATALAATDSAHADNKAIEIDATDQPGLYRVDWPDAAFAAGVRQVILTVKCATCFTEHMAVEIDPPVDAVKIGGTAQTGNDVGADVNEILTDTAVIGALGAGLTALATQASVNTIDGIVDDILVDTAVIGALGAGLTALSTQVSVDNNALAIAAISGTIGTNGAGLTDLPLEDVWTVHTPVIGIDTGLSLDRIYEMLNNPLKVTDATGAVVLRNLADGANIATGSVTDNLTTTIRTVLTWV